MNSLEERNQLMKLMMDADPFFSKFNSLDDEAFAESIIPRRYKELTMISISIATHCKECIEVHIHTALKCDASRDEIIEAIKIGMMAGGSLTFPFVRYAFKVINEALV